MDVLGSVVSQLRSGPAVSYGQELRAPWALRFSPSKTSAFHIVLQGTCWLLVEDEAPLALSPGDVVLLPRGAPHVLADDPRTTPIDVTCVDHGELAAQPHAGTGLRTLLLSGGYGVDRNRPHPLMLGLPNTIHVSATPGRHASLRSLITVLSDELANRKAGASAVASPVVEALLPLIVRAWLDESARSETGGDWAVALGDTIVSSALERIHSEPEREWTVAALAEEVGVSRAALARRFTAAVGEPPLTYLTEWRMTVAGRLLRESDLTISAVAQKVGYTSEYAFSRAFKRSQGVAPGGYRRAT